jgi:hypothetical protein
MEYDFYSIGFGEGVWINPGHWYADPFYLYSDFNIDRQYESTLEIDYNAISYGMIDGGGQNLYFLYAAINSSSYEPIPIPVPVPEPSSFSLCLVGLILIFLFNKVLTRRIR